jgi:hypothetical protein
MSGTRLVFVKTSQLIAVKLVRSYNGPISPRAITS